jgi:hypothetical protein
MTIEGIVTTGTPAGGDWEKLPKEQLNDRLRDERFPLIKIDNLDTRVYIKNRGFRNAERQLLPPASVDAEKGWCCFRSSTETDYIRTLAEMSFDTAGSKERRVALINGWKESSPQRLR